MTGDTDLPRQKHVPLQNAAPCQSCLCADDIVLPHHAGVTHLYETVDLGAAFHPRFPYGGPVNGCEALDFDIVLDYRNS